MNIAVGSISKELGRAMAYYARIVGVLIITG